jgi:hypothetical protein
MSPGCKDQKRAEEIVLARRGDNPVSFKKLGRRYGISTPAAYGIYKTWKSSVDSGDWPVPSYVRILDAIRDQTLDAISIQRVVGLSITVVYGQLKALVADGAVIRTKVSRGILGKTCYHYRERKRGEAP